MRARDAGAIKETQGVASETQGGAVGLFCGCPIRGEDKNSATSKLTLRVGVVVGVPKALSKLPID